MLTCSNCLLEKNESEFHKQNSIARGYVYACKSCITITRKKERKAVYEEVYFYLIEKGCKICGESNPLVLEFDHINPETKKYSISKLCVGNYPLSTVMKEISKCQVLCSNCHRIKTHKERNTLPYQIHKECNE